jgi:hypothetical protein
VLDPPALLNWEENLYTKSSESLSAGAAGAAHPSSTLSDPSSAGWTHARDDKGAIGLPAHPPHTRCPSHSLPSSVRVPDTRDGNAGLLAIRHKTACTVVHEALVELYRCVLLPLLRPLAQSHEGPVPSAAALTAARPHPTPLLCPSVYGSRPDTVNFTKRSHKTGTILAYGDGSRCHYPHSRTSLCIFTGESNDRQPHYVP